MIKGLAITPPVIGRISIGRVIERNGKRLPEKDDEFTITSQVQNRDGWVNHPLDEAMRGSPDAKLRSIPVRLLFNKPELNLRANYSLFDRQTGRPICVGNGVSCKRSLGNCVKTMECPGPYACELGQTGGCKPYGRLHVQVGDEDELGSFVFRTTGFNSIRTLFARLSYFDAVSGGLLSAMPLELRLRGKSTTLSHRTPIYYVDLTVRTGMSLNQAILFAREEVSKRCEAGFDQPQLDQAAAAGYEAGEFEETPEDGVDVVQEFYPEAEGAGEVLQTSPIEQIGLSTKLAAKAAVRNGNPPDFNRT